MNLLSQQHGQPPGQPVHAGTQTRQPGNCGSQARRWRLWPWRR